MDQWNVIFNKGATYQTTITMTGVADIATATAWRMIFAFPDQAPFLTASTTNGLITAGATSAQKIVTIPAATTALFDTGNGRFDFEIEWAGGLIRRYVAGGNMQVNPATGEVLP
jgi:hypothetical protein